MIGAIVTISTLTLFSLYKELLNESYEKQNNEMHNKNQ